MINKLSKSLFGVLSLSCFSLALCAQSNEQQCKKVEKLVDKIEKHGEKYYTVENYVFKDKLLIEELNQIKPFMKGDKYLGLLNGLNKVQSNTQESLSQLADIAEHLHNWSGENCF